MEQPIIKSYAELVDEKLVELVSQTNFATRYYQLCRQHSLQIHKSFSCTKSEMIGILAEIGQSPQWDARDKSYSFNFFHNGWEINRGFVMLHKAIDFWFSAKNGTLHVGGKYTIVARTAVELINTDPPRGPRAPRPCCYSPGELKIVLKECFQLSDLLCGLLDKIPRKKINLDA